MTVCNIRRAVTSAKYSWSRLAAMTAGLLLATVCTGGSAFAADDCGAKPAHHSASTQCLEHRLRTGVHGASKTQKTARTKAGESASPSDGDELTPASAAVSSFTAVAAPPWAAPTAEHVGLSSMTLPASRTVHRLGRGGEGWPPSADSLVAAGASSVVGGPQGAPHALGALAHGGGMLRVPAPFAWAILLLGLFGLIVIARQPGVARAQAWAMSSLPSPVARSAAGVPAVDRVDPARYAEGPARRSHQGHFVRAAAGAHFGS